MARKSRTLCVPLTRVRRLIELKNSPGVFSSPGWGRCASGLPTTMSSIRAIRDSSKEYAATSAVYKVEPVSAHSACTLVRKAAS